MAYCDEDFYVNEFKGDVISDEAALDRELTRASRAVDRATKYRIGDLAEWPEFTQQQVKLAVCTQAEHSYQFGDMQSVTAALGGYSIGDVSVSAKTETHSGLEKFYKLTSAAIEYLMPTGLLDRRLR